MIVTYLDFAKGWFSAIFSGFCVTWLLGGTLAFLVIGGMKLYRLFHRKQKMERLDFVLSHLATVLFLMMLFASLPIAVSLLKQNMAEPPKQIPGERFLIEAPAIFVASVAFWIIAGFFYVWTFVHGRYRREYPKAPAAQSD